MYNESSNHWFLTIKYCDPSLKAARGIGLIKNGDKLVIDLEARPRIGDILFIIYYTGEKDLVQITGFQPKGYLARHLQPGSAEFYLDENKIARRGKVLMKTS